MANTPATTPNEDLDEIRELSSYILNHHDDYDDAAIDLANAVIRLDIKGVSGRLPDGWAMSKLSKSNYS